MTDSGIFTKAACPRVRGSRCHIRSLCVRARSWALIYRTTAHTRIVVCGECGGNRDMIGEVTRTDIVIVRSGAGRAGCRNPRDACGRRVLVRDSATVYGPKTCVAIESCAEILESS